MKSVKDLIVELVNAYGNLLQNKGTYTEKAIYHYEQFAVMRHAYRALYKMDIVNGLSMTHDDMYEEIAPLAKVYGAIIREGKI